MAAPPLTSRRLTRLANTLLDAGEAGLTDRAHREIATALRRAATLVAEIKVVAGDCPDWSAVDTRRRLQEAVRDFELGERFGAPQQPASLSLNLQEVQP